MNTLSLQITLPPSFIPHIRAKLSDNRIVENNSEDSIVIKTSTQEDSVVLITLNLKTSLTNREIVIKANQLKHIKSYDFLNYNCIHFIEELLDIEIMKKIALGVGTGLSLFAMFKIMKARQA